MAGSTLSAAGADVTPFHVAVIPAVPMARPRATPPASTNTTVGLSETHAAPSVTSAVVASEYVARAVMFLVLPRRTVELDGSTSMRTSDAGATVSVPIPIRAAYGACTRVMPVASATTTPADDTLATAGSSRPQVTSAVRS